jgi:hypothetical protein
MSHDGSVFPGQLEELLQSFCIVLQTAADVGPLQGLGVEIIANMEKGLIVVSLHLRIAPIAGRRLATPYT